jgi:HEAT repeat protein
VILGLAGALARVPPSGPPQRLLERARAALRSSDAGLRREAALVLGRLEDADAAFELAELLDAELYSDRHSAAWALTQITGIALAPRAALWSTWLAAESEFWDEEGADLIAKLDRMNRVQQGDALRELAQHPWRRADIARALAPLLRSPDPKVARLTGFVLADLGGSAAHQALRAAARGDTEGVSESLCEALQRLDGAPAVPRRKKQVGARDSSRRASDDR